MPTTKGVIKMLKETALNDLLKECCIMTLNEMEAEMTDPATESARVLDLVVAFGELTLFMMENGFLNEFGEAN